MRGGNGFGVKDFAVGSRAAMKIRAVPGGDAIDPIMWIVLRHIDPPGDDIGGADPIDAATFGYLGRRFDQASARIDPIAWVDVTGIGAICQGKTKASAGRNRRKASPCRACPTPHHPPSRGGTIEFERGQIVAKVRRRAPLGEWPHSRRSSQSKSERNSLADLLSGSRHSLFFNGVSRMTARAFSARLQARFHCIVSKRLGSMYRRGRSPHEIKV